MSESPETIGEGFAEGNRSAITRHVMIPSTNTTPVAAVFFREMAHGIAGMEVADCLISSMTATASADLASPVELRERR